MSAQLTEEATRRFVAAIALAIFAAPALADIDPNSGIDFVRIGAVGNAPWAGDGTPGDRAIGRGGVNYEYNIGRFEVTTSQWVQFFNAAYDRPANDRLPHLIPPTFWGATPAAPNTPGGLRWIVPAGNEMLPVGNISWRMAAMYCNWLHNDRSAARDAFLNGAYDVSTFGYVGTVFTDQLTHDPGARYWIPTWDEHLKASHYDPSLNAGEGGWWRYNVTSDTAPAYGPPGVHVRTSAPFGPDPNGPLAQANAGWQSSDFPGYDPFSIPLGAYPEVQSPWGLLDVAGATTEWTEQVIFTNGVFPTDRLFDGSPWRLESSNTLLDAIYYRGGDFPSISLFDTGFRIASSVPTPCSSALLVGLIIHASWQKRRR